MPASRGDRSLQFCADVLFGEEWDRSSGEGGGRSAEDHCGTLECLAKFEQFIFGQGLLQAGGLQQYCNSGGSLLQILGMLLSRSSIVSCRYSRAELADINVSGCDEEIFSHKASTDAL